MGAERILGVHKVSCMYVCLGERCRKNIFRWKRGYSRALERAFIISTLPNRTKQNVNLFAHLFVIVMMILLEFVEA